MGFKHETPLRGWLEIKPLIKDMLDPNDAKLRGWKEIKPVLGKGNCRDGYVDKRTAMKMLLECGLLHREGGRPYLYRSEYRAVRTLIGEGSMKIVNGVPELYASDYLKKRR